jgi:hypothetical protein
MEFIFTFGSVHNNLNDGRPNALEDLQDIKITICILNSNDDHYRWCNLTLHIFFSFVYGRLYNQQLDYHQVLVPISSSNHLLPKLYNNSVNMGVLLQILTSYQELLKVTLRSISISNRELKKVRLDLIYRSYITLLRINVHIL